MAEFAQGAVRRIFGNLGRLLSGKAAAGVLSLTCLALGARTLGSVDLGVLILLQTYVMTIAGIIEFPGWQAVVRYGAESLAKNDAGRLTRLVAFTGAVELAFGALAIATAAALAPFVGARLHWPPEAMKLTTPFSLVVLSTVRGTPAGYLQVTRRYDLLALHQLTSPALRLVGAAVAIATQAGLPGFLIAWLVAAVADCFVMWTLGAYAARSRLSPSHLRPGLASVPRENPGLWRFMLGANLDFTLSEFSGRVTPLLVGYLLGASDAGLFAVAQRVAAVLTELARVLGQATYSELAHVVASRASGRELARVVRRASGAAVLAAGPFWAATALFGRHIATLLGGAAFAAAAPVMAWLAFSRMISLALPPLNSALVALGRPGFSILANAIGAGGMLISLPLLVRWLGLLGVGVQSALQALITVGLFAVLLAQAIAARETRPAVARVAGD